MFEIIAGEYTIQCQSTDLPSFANEYYSHAALADNIELENSEGTRCFLSIGRSLQWPFLVITQTYHPGPEVGLCPGAIIIPETDILLVGAGQRLLAYDLKIPEKLWEDSADTGFWNWNRHGDIIIMSAELECAAWDINGHKLWTTFVEPPWEYTVSESTLYLDVMGAKSSFQVKEGPQK